MALIVLPFMICFCVFHSVWYFPRKHWGWFSEYTGGSSEGVPTAIMILGVGLINVTLLMPFGLALSVFYELLCLWRVLVVSAKLMYGC